MAVCPFESPLYGALFSHPETAALFGDEAEIAAMIEIEAALARVQGRMGLIPSGAAREISAQAAKMRIDPAALAEGAARDGVPVPALIRAMRAAMGKGDAAQYIHFGATSQDILDSSLMLRLSRAAALWAAMLDPLLKTLAQKAQEHAQTPMAMRTWGQAAVPGTFGALIAAWGWPLHDLRQELAALRDGGFPVSLSGAAGTASALGDDPAALRAALARELGLSDPRRSWHADRQPLVRIFSWCARACGSLGKMGRDLHLLAQSGIGEVAAGPAGGSSTMPQKANPVQPALLVALARHVGALMGPVLGGLVHELQRDGAPWMGEWLVQGQIGVATSRALQIAQALAATLRPDAQAMQRNIAATRGQILAEQLSFALGRRLGRVEAQAQIKALSARARDEGRDLAELAAEAFPGLADPALAAPDPGQAPAEARAFARAVLG